MERPSNQGGDSPSAGDRNVVPAILAEATRLLLEYNESTTAIRRAVTRTAWAVSAVVDDINIS